MRNGKRIVSITAAAMLALSPAVNLVRAEENEAADVSVIPETMEEAVVEATVPEVTEAPTAEPTAVPTEAPTAVPTAEPTAAPTDVPTAAPTAVPTEAPTAAPTEELAVVVTAIPAEVPTAAPTEAPAEPQGLKSGYAVVKKETKAYKGPNSGKVEFSFLKGAMVWAEETEQGRARVLTAVDGKKTEVYIDPRAIGWMSEAESNRMLQSQTLEFYMVKGVAVPDVKDFCKTEETVETEKTGASAGNQTPAEGNNAETESTQQTEVIGETVVTETGNAGMVSSDEETEEKPEQIVLQDVNMDLITDIAADLRTGANGQSAILTTIPANVVVHVVGKTGDWAYVTYGGQSGYIFREAIPALFGGKTEAAEEPEATEKPKVKKKVFVFSDRKSVMEIGETVHLTSRLEGFENCTDITYQWEYNDGNGFVPMEGATEDSYSFAADIQSLSRAWRLTVYFNEP